MPTTFSAATCITYNPGPVPATGPFEIYLNNNYDVPPYNLTPVNLSQISGSSCPYIIEVPTGTTVINFKDIPTSYCISIPVQDNNICQTCNLGLSLYSASTTSVITFGVLTGSCQSIISDYKINWYGPDSTTELLWSTGSGAFQIPQSDYNHPLHGSSLSIPAVAGVYTPIIENVTINGYSYSNTGGTNNIPSNFIGCLPTTTVLPLTCETKTNYQPNYPYSAYTHYLSLNVSSNTPQPVTSTLKVSADTKYIAWAFRGYEKPDRLTITFSGANYGTTEIILEDYIIGGTQTTNTTNVTPNIIPKSVATYDNFFTKITTLTGLTINPNDNVIFKITPSESLTLWDLYLNCLTDWECNECITDKNYKIIGSTIQNITGDCDTRLSFSIDSCDLNGINIQNSDLITYYYFGLAQNNDSITNYILNLNNSSVNALLYQNKGGCGGYGCSYPGESICTTGLTPTTYHKTFLTDGRGVFGFTGSSQVISSYYNNWINYTTGACSGSTDVNNLNYYRVYIMVLPSQTRPDNCGDVPVGVPKSISLYIHHTSTVLTGTTGGLYYMSLTANTITNNMTFGSCSTCPTSINSYVSLINSSSTSTETSYGTGISSPKTFSSGVYFTNQFYCNYLQITSNSAPEGALSGLYTTTSYVLNTYPFSGTPTPTIVPSLSGTVCNYNSSGNAYDNSFYGYEQYDHYKFYYKYLLTNPLDLRDFDIWAAPIVNYSADTTNLVLAYRYSGGTITSNPTYVI